FFELLKFHREDTGEIELAKRKGRRVFVLFIQEFREVLAVVNKVCEQWKPYYTNRGRMDLAYMAFYYGVGDTSTPMLVEATGRHPRELVDKLVEELTRIQERYREMKTRVSEAKISPTHHSTEMRELREISGLSYVPFDGHQSRLAHYFRNLFQLIKYLSAHGPSREKLDYADIVRAQLSNHEQALFCLNALTKLGNAWLTEHYLDDYQLIKNIPKSFFNPLTELDLKETFPKVRFEFEKREASFDERNDDD
ncbi:MAG TPA: putative phage abortive infection protein, partial [Opitutaceae bacterium]|nr:putative phage abortive infection protein [Opitutaceae bacterium]